MDNITHAALGIAAGITFRRAGVSIPAAALAGLIAAESPDLDVFIRSFDDPLASFRWHRHFTHSFLFTPIWAILGALISAWWYRRRADVHWRDLLLPSFAGAVTHLLCDACTSYGTMLLWPFDYGRYAWDCIGIIDLFATLPLLVLAILALKNSSPKLALYGLIGFASYALFGVWQQGRAEAGMRVWLKQNDVVPERISVKPTVLNLFVWRAVWLNGGQWYTAAVHVTPFRYPQLIVGESRTALIETSLGLPAKQTYEAAIIADFSKFTQNWNTYTLEGSEVWIGDIRFAMLPTSARPLWSVRYSAKEPITVIIDRSLRPGDWGNFMQMIWGTHPDYISLRHPEIPR